MRRRLLEEKESKDWSKEYLTFTAVTTFVLKFEGTTPSGGTVNTVQYSNNNGRTWNTLGSGTYLSLNAGNSVMFKGECVPYYNSSTGGIGIFKLTTGSFKVSGNIMSLLYGDDFSDKTSLSGKSYAFMGIFRSCTGVVDMTNLSLPATTLASSCYEHMFSGCTSLTSIPSGLLPATTASSGCYRNMFLNCTGLTSIPSDLLPATTLSSQCYANMFRCCTGLNRIPRGFLPATTLAGYCYEYMFSGCTGLTSIPFDLLPATILKNNCYESMFDGCTNITSAPYLTATTLVSDCYRRMFQGCSKLNYIRALFKTTPGADYTYSWVYGVAASGTFVKKSTATWSVTGDSGIPSGWTVKETS